MVLLSPSLAEREARWWVELLPAGRLGGGSLLVVGGAGVHPLLGALQFHLQEEGNRTLHN